MNEKWGRRLFKSSAVLLLLLGLVHLLAVIQKPVPQSDSERRMYALMNERQNLMGTMRSTMELFQGFNLSFSLAALFAGALNLFITKSPADILKRAALVNALWWGAMTATSIHYFFIAPTAFIAAVLVLFAASWFVLAFAGKAQVS